MLGDIWIDRKIYEFFYVHKKNRNRLGMPEKQYQNFLKMNHPKIWKSYKKALKIKKERFKKEEADILILPTWYTPRFFK